MVKSSDDFVNERNKRKEETLQSEADTYLVSKIWYNLSFRKCKEKYPLVFGRHADTGNDLERTDRKTVNLRH